MFAFTFGNMLQYSIACSYYLPQNGSTECHAAVSQCNCYIQTHSTEYTEDTVIMRLYEMVQSTLYTANTINYTERHSCDMYTRCMNSCITWFYIMVVGYHFIVMMTLLHKRRKVLAMPCRESKSTTIPLAPPPLSPHTFMQHECIHVMSVCICQNLFANNTTLQRHSTPTCLPSGTW